MIKDRTETIKLDRGKHMLSYYEDNGLNSKAFELNNQTVLNLPADKKPEQVSTPTSKKEKAFVFAVGIGDYKDETVPDLPITIDDAEDFAAKIQQLYTPDSDCDTKILTGSQASKKNITDFLKEAIYAYIDKNTTVFIYFSGHGTQVPDNNGDEDDSLDEALVPYDYNSLNVYNSLIMDDDLYEMYRKIGDSSKKAFVIIDSCFSGGARKGIKTIDSSSMMKGFGDENKDAMESEIKDNEGNFLFLSAAMGNQKAYANLNSRIDNSMFTYYLLQALDGEADKNGDDKVDETELLDYLEKTMENAEREYGLMPQNPLLINPSSISFEIPVGKRTNEK
jgi:uncharacterized caspase-like protein